MAVYKLNSRKKKSSTNVKKTVGFSLLIAASVLFLFLTGIVGFMQDFLLGIFGVFGFPLAICMFIVGLALVNNRKYVMSPRYTICLVLSVFFLLCIIQLAIVGNKTVVGNTTEAFGDYLARNYLQKWTAGGILIGLFTTCFLYIAGYVGAFIICSIGLVICLALLIDCLNFLKKQTKEHEPVSLQIKSVGNKTKTEAKTLEAQETNVVLDGNLKEQARIEETQTMSAKQILGLDKKREKAYEYERHDSQTAAQPPQTKRSEPAKVDGPKSLRELILTPPEIDLDEYFKDMKTAPTKQEADAALQELKEEPQKAINVEGYGAQPEQSRVFYDDEFRFRRNSASQSAESAQNVENDENMEKNELTSDDEDLDEKFDDFEDEEADERALEEIDSEEIVSVADDLLRSAIAEEREENKEYYEQTAPKTEEEAQSFERNRVFERNDSAPFSRRNDSEDEFAARAEESAGSRETFSRRDETKEDYDRNREAFEQSLRSREEKGMSQDDLDARSQFRRESESLNMRNGTYARENSPIEPEEEPKPREPYIYEKPPIDLITTESVDLSTMNADVATKRVLLENTLETFGVPAKVTGVVVGPAVTRYELEMPQGISVQKIKNRADDIALSLAAEGTIRIEAPIPGKSVVGIEVPNSSIATISLRDVIGSREFQEAKSPLTFALGKDITGRIICADMRKLTHLLVAGSTGSGKSVCLNSIILSIIYKASPEDVKLVLIDPKRVEFANYEALPHLIMPEIVCDTQKAISTLAWAVNEMERRFEALGNARVREISEFNATPDVQSGKIQKMPYIVIIVDELADLMMTGKKEVEDKVCRLAQKARAAGIHLILATQRPSVDVITGLIKSNFPSRISFAVSSAVDSMTILDRVGAEKLLGKGDMFYFPNGAKDPSRVQGCFITTNEINSIVDFARDYNEAIFDPDIAQAINNPNKGSSQGGGANTEMDELLPQALKISIQCGQASATMIRRKFAVGYPRAAKIIDQMEAAGYISSADGVKGRSVLISEEEFLDLFGDV